MQDKQQEDVRGPASRQREQPERGPEAEAGLLGLKNRERVWLKPAEGGNSGGK